MRSRVRFSRPSRLGGLSLAQHHENLELGCGYRGFRWISDYESHYHWCLQVAKDAAQLEADVRNRTLSRCRGE
jgi:hypothetical protein